MTMETVYISKRGKVYHSNRNCLWLRNTRDLAEMLGRRIHPVMAVTPGEAGRRVACRVCANGGESPKRGKGNG